MARINEFRTARRGRRAVLLAAAALLALAVLQVGTSSALVPADLVDTYSDATYVTPKTVFAPGETVFARGGFAGSTRSYEFIYSNPSASVVRDTGCLVRNLSAPGDGASNGFDSLTLAANAPAGIWTLRFIEWPNTTCTDPPNGDGKRNRTANFSVVSPPTATVSTTIHNSGHAAVTAVPVGTTVHDFVRVDGGPGNPVPTGNVTIDWFLNGTCTGRPAANSGPLALNASGEVDAAGFAFTVNTAADRAFKAHYAGGGSYAAADGPCETLHVVDANIQITPQTDANAVGTNHVLTITVNALNGTIDAGPHTATASIVSGPGSFVPAVGGDTCTYVGGAASASCTVTISSATTGTTVVSATSTIPVNGVSMTRTTDGTGGSSGPATKYWADDTVTTVVRDAAGNDVGTTVVGGGTVVHDEATVTKTPGTPTEVAPPGGTVDFTLYDNGTCNGNVVDTDTGKPLVGGTATSDPFAIPAAVGTYSYLAHYNGDRNYPAQDGPCEPFSFDGVAPVTTIVLDPTQPDSCCWYVFAVKPTVSATDVGTGVLETRCVLDPATPPTSFADLPPGMCPYLAPSSWVVTDGIHTLYAGSIDGATPGNTDLVQVTFKIDKTPPTSQVDPLPQFQPSPGAFTVSWSGMDNLSGIKDFDVRYRTAPAGGSFGPYTQWFTDTTLTSALFTPTPGSTTCFSVRARDRACWEQPTYSPEVCTTAPYDDPSLTRTGSWSTVSGSGYFGPGVSRSTTYNNKLTLSNLRASVVGVLVTKQPGGGPIELRWNGSTKLSTSLSAATVQKKQLLTFTLPSVQTGTLEIVQTNYGTVDIDAAGAWKAS